MKMTKKQKAINSMKSSTGLKAAGIVAASPLIVNEYKEDKAEKGKGRAAVEAVATTAALAIAPPLLLAAGAAVGAAWMGGEKMVELGKKAIEIDRQYQQAGTAAPFSTARFFETKDTFTMRQASMAAIGQARGNLENYMMGNEAQFLR